MSKPIKSLTDVYSHNFYDMDIDSFWSTSERKELKAHRIHAYPAKFPAFISEKALAYAEQRSFYPQTIADVFCGCGTVAFEAKRKNIDFWGCDINPVATMIAKVKSNHYDLVTLNKMFKTILSRFHDIAIPDYLYDNALNRLKYWYFENEYNNLFKLKQAIDEITRPTSKYRLFFYCAFSNILKSTSRWLTKSIKPQIDPNKVPADVSKAFFIQCQTMISAYSEADVYNHSKTKIITGNFLKIRKPKVDMIITSPPYVTSYEYADLHQLSSLWLGFTEDYRSLRSGSIGTLSHHSNFEMNIACLSHIGKMVIKRLHQKDKKQAHSVAKYFADMQHVIQECATMLNPDAYFVFVIGDTEYRSIHIENARYTVELMLQNEFKNVSITKRKVSKKILTPYRDSFGRFTANASSRRVYGEEFIILGQKA